MGFEFGPNGNVTLPEDGVVEPEALAEAYGKLSIMRPQNGCLDDDWELYRRNMRAIINDAPALQRSYVGCLTNDEDEDGPVTGMFGPHIVVEHQLFKVQSSSSSETETVPTKILVLDSLPCERRA